MTSATQLQAGKESYTYSGANLIGQTASNGTKYTYGYNAQHDVISAAADGISNAYTYDTAGNMLSSKLTNTKDSQYLYSSATATTDRNSTATVTDVNGNKTTYTYNGYTGQISTVKNAKNQTINYLYTETNGRAEQTYQSGIASIDYSYSKGSLAGLSRKTFKSGTEQWQKYGFSTNNWGQTTAITVSGSTNGTSWSSAKTLASYSYAANNGNLTRMTYGNGQYVNYTYDAFDRVVRMEYNSGRYITYRYNAEGALAEMTYGDGSTKLGSYTYEYDSLGRLIRSNEYDGSGNAVQRTEHKYDANNRLKSQAWTVGSTAYSESYTYDDPNAATGKTSGDGSLLQMTTATGATIDFSYDTLKRLNKETVKSGSTTVMTTAYAYRTVSGNRSSAQVELRDVRNSAGTLLEGKKYTYDALGNITMISQSTGSNYPLVAYEYDAQNQLVKETYYNGNGTGSSNVTATYTYTYDTAGNILSETKTANGSTSTKTYTYGNSQWNDLLTSVNGESISYDAAGNPTSYSRGNSAPYNMSWVNGRQLSYMFCYEEQWQVAYTYDAEGNRTTKNDDGTRHTYVTQNGKVVRETINRRTTVEILDFIYDESGRPFALRHSTNGGTSFDTYYYILNFQGDVVKLVNASGTAYATYTYNAWGEVLTATGSMASINPLRYRGYYYDSETGFYYLQSRYYDPAMHRFINADSLASTGQGFVGTNMYAYCNNNPIAYKDPQGKYYVEFNTVGSVETAEGSTIDGITYYTTTIEYTTTIYTGSLYELFFGPRSYSSKVEIAFSIDSNSIVHIDNEKNANKQLNDSSVSKALATEVISSARAREPDALSGRTVEGVAMEIRIHYGIYSFGIKSHVDVADIGGTDKSKPGYDSNASFFERFCLL